MAKGTSGGKKVVQQMMQPPGGQQGKPSPSTVKKVGVTGPIQKPSPSTVGQVGITPPGPQGSGTKRKMNRTSGPY
jgi:hypothetical protein